MRALCHVLVIVWGACMDEGWPVRGQMSDARLHPGLGRESRRRRDPAVTPL